MLMQLSLILIKVSMAVLLGVATLGGQEAGVGPSRPGSPTDAASEDPAPERRRLITLGGAVTEIVYALGLGHEVVAADDLSVWPPETSRLERTGYIRTQSAEGLLSLRPTQVLASAEAGPPTVAGQVRAAGVHWFTVPEVATVEDACRRVTRLADVLGVPDRGLALAERMAAEIRTVAAKLDDDAPRPAVLCLYATSPASLHVAGSGTVAGTLIDLAGGRNVGGRMDHAAVSPERAAALAPEVLIIPRSSLELVGGRGALLSRPGLSLTPAARHGRVLVLDMVELFGFGPRTGATLDLMHDAFHPGDEESPAS